MFRRIPVDDAIVGGPSEKILKPEASPQIPSLFSSSLHLHLLSQQLKKQLPLHSTEVDRPTQASVPNAPQQLQFCPQSRPVSHIKSSFWCNRWSHHPYDRSE